MSKHGRSARSNASKASRAAAHADPHTSDKANRQSAAALNSARPMLPKQDNAIIGLSRDEEEKCGQAFKAFDKDGSEDIDSDELRIVLKMMGITVTEAKLQRMMNEANMENPTSISLAQFKRVIGKQRGFQNRSNEEDTLDAFVALGGSTDKSGSVDADQLIQIIKQQFEMTIDIESLIKEIDQDGSGKIEYDEFMSLLSFEH